MGTKIAEVMTDRPRAVTRQTSIREAAQLMGEEDVGSLPIVDEATRLVGIVTDRDIAVRAVGRGARHLLAGRDRRPIEHEELRHEASFRDPWLTVLRLRRPSWFGCCRGAGLHLVLARNADHEPK